MSYENRNMVCKNCQLFAQIYLDIFQIFCDNFFIVDILSAFLR